MWNTGNLRGDKSARSSARTFHTTPHMLLFLLYNLIYLVPLFCVYLWGYGQDSAANILKISSGEMWQIVCLYLAGIMSFTLGTKARSALHWSLGGRTRIAWTPLWIDVKSAEAIAAGVLIVLFLVLKVAIIPLGVYTSYAFDSGAMDSAIWTASMFTSEAMLLMAVLVLFSKTSHNVAWFFLLSTLNGINLLHGTRVFFIITVMVGIAYSYIKGRLPIWRIVLLGPLAFTGVLLASYFIFLVRSAVSVNGAFTPERILSPIVYESIFSQMSLITLITNPSHWSSTGHALNYFGDVLLFTIPRFLLPEKGSLLFHNTYADLSPLGAFNGYADGLIYFGIFFPAFYFALGLLASWLYRKAQTNSWWFVLYVYFSADFLFRVMRDGYLIPSKMLINTIEIVCALILWRPVCQIMLCKRSSVAGLSNPSALLP